MFTQVSFVSISSMACSNIPAPGMPSDWSVLTAVINAHSVGHLCQSERWLLQSAQSHDLDESTLPTALEDCMIFQT